MYCAELEQYIVGVINADDLVTKESRQGSSAACQRHLDHSEANEISSASGTAKGVEMIRDDDGQAQLRQAMLACFKKDDFNQTQQHKGVDVAVKLTWI